MATQTANDTNNGAVVDLSAKGSIAEVGSVNSNGNGSNAPATPQANNAVGDAAVNSTSSPSGTVHNFAMPQVFTGRPAGILPLGVREDTTHHASLFIGDLSPEVNDATLRAAFAAFASLSECRVMYDPNTGRSRGYGFASFGDAQDAHRALTTLNGEWLGSRPLRINWANQKTSHHHNHNHNHNRRGVFHPQGVNMGMGVNNSTISNGGGTPMIRMVDANGITNATFSGTGGFDMTGVPTAFQPQIPAPIPLTYEQVSQSSPPHNTTVYIGNLHPMTTQEDIAALFANISYVREVRIQSERGYGFAVLDTHDAATTAICQLGTVAGGPGIQLHGRVLRLSWGKDRNDGNVVYGRQQVFTGATVNSAGVVNPTSAGATAATPTTGANAFAIPTTPMFPVGTPATASAGNTSLLYGVQPTHPPPPHHVAYGAGFALPSTGYGPIPTTPATVTSATGGLEGSSNGGNNVLGTTTTTATPMTGFAGYGSGDASTLGTSNGLQPANGSGASNATSKNGTSPNAASSPLQQQQQNTNNGNGNDNNSGGMSASSTAGGAVPVYAGGTYTYGFAGPTGQSWW